MTLTILVAGAGVGGLTLAKSISVLALEQRKELEIEVIVVERSKVLPSTGHGLTLFEGVGVLSRLGLKDELDEISSILTKQIVTADGKHITSNKIEVENKEFYPRGVRRPDLVQVLFDSLVLEDDMKSNDNENNIVKVSVKFDWEVVDVVQMQDDVDNNKNKQNKVKIVNQRHEEIVGDILVGFDGINSCVRAAIIDATSTSSRSARYDSAGNCNSLGTDCKEFGQCCVLLGTAHYSKTASSLPADLNKTGLGTTLTPPPPDTLVHHFDRKTGSVGVYSSVGCGRKTSSYAWTIGYRCPIDPGRNPDWNDSDKGLASSLDLVTHGWSSDSSATSNMSPSASLNKHDFRSLLSCSKGCMELGIYTQSSTQAKQPWYYGSCMVSGGDSTHAVLPLLGEGANLALCDGVVLARHLMTCILGNISNNGADTTSIGRNDEKIRDAFQKYEDERRPFGASGITMTKFLRPIMLSQNCAVCYLRNIAMGHMLKHTWPQSYLRAQDAYFLLDRPMRNRNPHANIAFNDVGLVLAHVALIGGCITAIAWHYATS